MSISVQRGAASLRAILLGSSCLAATSLCSPSRAIEACVGLGPGQCQTNAPTLPWKTAKALEAIVLNGAPQILISSSDASGVGTLWVNGVARAQPTGFVGVMFSSDGSIILGQKALDWWWWRPETNTSGLLAGGAAQAASDKGFLIVGQKSYGLPLTWSWNAVNGGYDAPVMLPVPVGGVSGFASDVTPDGRTISGYILNASQTSQAVRWTLDGSAWKVESLGVSNTSGSGSSSTYAINANGSTIVGSYTADDGSTHAFVWRKGSGWLDPGVLGAGTTIAWDVSADGRIVVGMSQSLAFRWTEATGMKNLNVLLREAGVNMGSITLTSASRISGDGEWIIAKILGGASYVVRYADGLGGAATPETLVHSATELAGRRLGAMAQMQAYADPLIRLPYRFAASGPEQSSAEVFASAGSASGGLNARWFNGEGLTLRGGLAALTGSAPGADFRSSFLAAGSANYVIGEFAHFSPFVEAGGAIAPKASFDLQRSYMNGFNPVTVKGQTTGSWSYAYASLGGAFDFSTATQAALSLELGRYGLSTGGYAEAAGAGNPFNASMSSGRDSMGAVKFAGQVTHQLSDEVDLGLRMAAARGGKPSSEVSVAVAGMGESVGEAKGANWLEYGARLGYRINRRLSVNAFFNGVTGDRYTGHSLHGGLGLKVGF